MIRLDPVGNVHTAEDAERQRQKHRNRTFHTGTHGNSSLFFV
jgi:hypothetical protein